MNMEDKELLDLILNFQEWHKFECKRAAAKPSKLLETVIAFANTEGGIIVAGCGEKIRTGHYKAFERHYYRKQKNIQSRNHTFYRR